MLRTTNTIYMMNMSLMTARNPMYDHFRVQITIQYRITRVAYAFPSAMAPAVGEDAKLAWD